MKPLSSFLETPAVQKLDQRYGAGLRELPIATRLGILVALSSAAHAVHAVGVSEPLDMLFAETVADTDESPERELYALLSQLDEELSDFRQAIALVAGIAEGIAYASV
ncbi:MAG TPA: hypothetical protein V6D29_00350 [Leptolyngbyaceae cyanobacterium]